jgi:hypothetical protein
VASGTGLDLGVPQAEGATLSSRINPETNCTAGTCRSRRHVQPRVPQACEGVQDQGP